LPAVSIQCGLEPPITRRRALAPDSVRPEQCADNGFARFSASVAEHLAHRDAWLDEIVSCGSNLLVGEDPKLWSEPKAGR
jgi:hypothetical protein